MLDPKQKKTLRKMIAAALMIDPRKYEAVCELFSGKSDEAIIAESEQFLKSRRAQLEKVVAQAQSELTNL